MATGWVYHESQIDRNDPETTEIKVSNDPGSPPSHHACVALFHTTSVTAVPQLVQRSFRFRREQLAGK